MKKVDLIFFPMPAMGHLVSMVETAKLLLQHDDRFSITILIVQPSAAQSSVSAYIKSLDGAAAAATNTNRIRFIILPKPPEDLTKDVPPHKFLLTYIGGHKNQVKDIVVKSHLSGGDDGVIMGGFVIDMFCTPMIDVATELGLPTFVFITTGACFLSLMLNAEFLLESVEAEAEAEAEGILEKDLHCPGFVNPLPVKVLPTTFLIEEWKPVMFDCGRKFKEAKGILVNSIFELETCLFDSLSSSTTKKKNYPPVYHVGPILNLKGATPHDDQSISYESDIMKWLDDQPPSSVVFLCFGSMGGFSNDQVREIAFALEETGYRFLWSLRKQEKDKGVNKYGSVDYSNLEEILPEGFLNRTVGIGKVIGWAPQVKVLAHSSVSGFVSHCGWNSTLESIWFGVPIAAWPLYAEQQLNAFYLVKELGLAVEIQIDYRRDPRMGIEPRVVTMEKVSRGIVELMNRESDVRKRMKEMSEKVRTASVMGGGSSSLSLDCFLSNVLDNINKS